MNSFVFGFLWLFTSAIAGLYFKLGIFRDDVKWYNVVFYVVLLLTFSLLIRFYYYCWKEKASEIAEG